MDIKEIGGGAVVIIGGVAYTLGGGLGDALDADVKYISEVSYDERGAYMDGIVVQFSESFSSYIVQTETYDYVGTSKFNYATESGTFLEVVTSEEAVDTKDKNAVQAQMDKGDFCAQDEMTLFTDKGWNYRFQMTDDQGKLVYKITCQAADTGVPELRLSS